MRSRGGSTCDEAETQARLSFPSNGDCRVQACVQLDLDGAQQAILNEAGPNDLQLELCVDPESIKLNIGYTIFNGGIALRTSLPAYTELLNLNYDHASHQSACVLTLRSRTTGMEVGRWVYRWEHSCTKNHLIAVENLLRQVCNAPEWNEIEMSRDSGPTIPTAEQLSNIHMVASSDGMQELTGSLECGCSTPRVLQKMSNILDEDLECEARSYNLTFLLALCEVRRSLALDGRCIHVASTDEATTLDSDPSKCSKKTADPSKCFHLGFSFFAVEACAFRASHGLYTAAVLWLLADLSWMWILKPTIRPVCSPLLQCLTKYTCMPY